MQSINKVDENVVKVMFLNARSLHKHYLDVKKYVKFYLPHIAMFAETRLSIFDRNEEFEIENYRIFRNDERVVLPGQRPFHGTAVYCCTPCSPRYPKCHNILDVEVTICELECLPSVIIVGIYKSPSVPVRQLYEALRNLHSNILKCKELHIIMGDFNVNWLNKQQMSGLNNLMVSEYGYHQVVNEYTTSNQTVIDHI